MLFQSGGNHQLLDRLSEIVGAGAGAGHSWMGKSTENHNQDRTFGIQDQTSEIEQEKNSWRRLS